MNLKHTILLNAITATLSLSNAVFAAGAPSATQGSAPAGADSTVNKTQSKKAPAKADSTKRGRAEKSDKNMSKGSGTADKGGKKTDEGSRTIDPCKVANNNLPECKGK